MKKRDIKETERFAMMWIVFNLDMGNLHTCQNFIGLITEAC